MATSKGGTHYVVATGYEIDAVTGDKILRVHDAGTRTGANNLLNSVNTKFKQVLGYRIFRPEGDPAMTYIYSSINTSFIVTDPLGRKTGFDPINQANYREIPNAQYSIESTNTPNEPEYEFETLVEQYKYSNIESVENGTHRITLYGIETGPYSVTVYSFDKDGFRNDEHLFEGQITKGQSLVHDFMQSDESLPIINSEMNLHYAFYLDPGNWKKNSADDRLVIQGKISSELVLENKFKITIGGISGYSMELLSRDFNIAKSKKETLYRSKNSKINKVIVSSNGNFWIHIKDINLDLIQKNKWGEIIIEVDDISAQMHLQLNCVGRMCYKK